MANARNISSKLKSQYIYVFMVVMLILLLFAAYFYKSTKSSVDNNPKEFSPKKTLTQNVQKETVYISPTASATPTVTSTLKFSSTFQKYLYNNCPELTDSKFMDQNLIPVVVSGKDLLNNKTKRIVCFKLQDSTSYIDIPFKDATSEQNLRYMVYDKYSSELGHGGYPFIGIVGTKIFEENGIQINIFLYGGEIGAIVGQSSVYIRGQKELKTSDGGTFFVNIQREAIKEDNPKLIEILNTYGKPSPFEGDSNMMTLQNYEGLDEKIAKQFFGDIHNLGPSEKTVFQQIKDDLSAVSSKI